MARRKNRLSGNHNPAGRIHHEGSLQLDRRSTIHLMRVDGQTIAVTTDGTGLRSVVLLSEAFDPVFEEANKSPVKAA
jgi:hypothetical protein